jgi:hypothetical protein
MKVCFTVVIRDKSKKWLLEKQVMGQKKLEYSIGGQKGSERGQKGSERVRKGSEGVIVPGSPFL